MYCISARQEGQILVSVSINKSKIWEGRDFLYCGLWETKSSERRAFFKGLLNNIFFDYYQIQDLSRKCLAWKDLKKCRSEKNLGSKK